MSDYNSRHTGAEVDEAVDKATKVVANPTLAGTESNLNGVEIAGTKYKVAAEITIDSAMSDSSENPVQNKVITSALSGKQSTIDSNHKLSSDLVDDTNHTNKFVTTSEKNTWNNKQDALVSGTNIKTVNNTSLLGSGNIEIPSGTEVEANPTLSGSEADLTAIEIDGTKYKVPFTANSEVTTNKVTSLSAASTDTQYPSAKCVYDLIGNIETLLAAI